MINNFNKGRGYFYCLNVLRLANFIAIRWTFHTIMSDIKQ